MGTKHEDQINLSLVNRKSRNVFNNRIMTSFYHKKSTESRKKQIGTEFEEWTMKKTNTNPLTTLKRKKV